MHFCRDVYNYFVSTRIFNGQISKMRLLFTQMKICKKKKNTMNLSNSLILIQMEYCGLRSWNLVIKSTRIFNSSNVNALYMAARTPPTNLQITKRFVVRLLISL